MSQPLRIGMIGAGNIAGQYLASFDRLHAVELVAVADLDAARAAGVAAQRTGVRACGVQELLADPDIEMVLNLTVPNAHAEVASAAIAAGKGVYGEKPLCATTDEARRVLAAAESAGVRLGCAPDTVLGTGIQTARAAIDAGWVGTPTAAVGTFVSSGPERWHPGPDFVYKSGGGPLYDMGPYYLTALVLLLGPVASVLCTGGRSRAVRVIGSGPRAGDEIVVEIDTHVAGILTHASGAVSTVTFSFDGGGSGAPPLEIHGTEGTLQLPDPNTFDGENRLLRADGGDGWEVLPVSAGYRNAGRGYGLADLAATPDGVEPRLSGRLAFHVLDVMETLSRAAATGERMTLSSTVDRPAAVPLADAPA